MRAHGIQRFTGDGTWVKPPIPAGRRAVADVTLKGSDGRHGLACIKVTADSGEGRGGPFPGYRRAPQLDPPGQRGEVIQQEADYDDLPGLVPVEAGQSGGYAVITTHVAEEIR